MPRQIKLLTSPFLLRKGTVVLHPFTRRELLSAEYLKWMNDPQVTRTIGRFDYLFPVSRTKLIEYFDSIDTDSTIFLGIHVQSKTRDKQRFVGTLKIYDIDQLARRAAIGIMVGDTKVWGRGIASTAIHLACRYIFEELGFRKIVAGYLATNAGIHRAFEKNGFEIEGVLREQVFFAGRLVDHILVSKFRNDYE